VHSIRGALFFENRGADEITLSSSLNRNFHLLEELKTSVRTPLKLIVNNNCLLDCPLHIYHSNITAHASRLDERTRGFFIDYCRLSCRYLRLADPSNFLKADWIRPEDLQLYESMGIDRFKITDRALSTDAIIRISASYCARRHEGNLVDLFPQNKDFVVFRRRNPLRLFKYFFRPLRANPFKLYELTRLMKDAEVVIDNRALDGFLEDVRHKDCFSRSCGACGYCDKLAHSLVKINTPGITEQLSAYREFMQRLVQGDVFRY
jgi:collagenase-like PrtC family protease